MYLITVMTTNSSFRRNDIDFWLSYRWKSGKQHERHIFTKTVWMKEAREIERGPDHEGQLKCDRSIQLLHSQIA